MRRTHKKSVVYKIASGFSNEMLSSQQCNLKQKQILKAVGHLGQVILSILPRGTLRIAYKWSDMFENIFPKAIF